MTGISRRQLGVLSGALSVSSVSESQALERVPFRGVLKIRVPWAIEALDPDALGDPLSAAFLPFVTETLYARNGATLFPTLTEALPKVEQGLARVTLRPGLRAANGAKFLAVHALQSLERARRGPAMGLFAEWQDLSVDPEGDRTLLIRTSAPHQVADILCCAASRMTEANFSPKKHRGLGAFTAEIAGRRLVLSRNLSAPRGPAYLDSIVVERADSLGDALSAFEAGDSAVGWFGKGLYRPRAGAIPFSAGSLGWVVLRSHAGLGRWGAPGVLQALLDGTDLTKLGHVGIVGEPPRAARGFWGGPPTTLLVDTACSQLVEAAQVMAGTLSQPGHELLVKRVSKTEIERASATREPALSLEFVRALGSKGEHMLVTLLAAQDPKLALHPPKLKVNAAREVALTLPLGVVGELKLRGACDARFVNLERFELADVWWREPI